MSAKHGVSYSMYPHYKMRRRLVRYSSQKNNSVIIIEEAFYPPDEIETNIIIVNGDIPFKKDFDEQLKELLNLGLVIHPDKEDNCWDIYCSTKDKALTRISSINQIFPHTTGKYLVEEGVLKVNLYGEIII